MTPAEQQIQEWQKNKPAQPIRIAEEVLRDDFSMTVPMAHGDPAVPKEGHHAVLKVVVRNGCDLTLYEREMRRRLDEIGWEWVTVKLNEAGKAVRFGMAPIRPRQVGIAYHVTLKACVQSIMDKGLLPGGSAIQHTNFPDTEGRIHLAEKLEGDGGAVRWISILGKASGHALTDYCVLEVNLQGIDGRMYQDAHSQFGLVIDKIDRIPWESLKVVEESAYRREDAAPAKP